MGGGRKDQHEAGTRRAPGGRQTACHPCRREAGTGRAPGEGPEQPAGSRGGAEAQADDLEQDSEARCAGTVRGMREPQARRAGPQSGMKSRARATPTGTSWHGWHMTPRRAAQSK